jgi:DnaJ-class molecular chaperone
MFNNDFAENREGEVKDTDSSVANPSQGAPSDFDTSESEDMDERSQHISQQYYDRYKQVTEPKYLYIFFVSLGVIILFCAMLNISRSGHRGPTTRDAQIDVYVDLKDVYMGNSLELRWKKTIVCPTCGGTGAQSPNDLVVCTHCHGIGYRVVEQRVGGLGFRTQQTCPVCGGLGHFIKQKCSKCGGYKLVRVDYNTTFYVPKGAPEGHIIVTFSQSLHDIMSLVSPVASFTFSYF